MQQEQDKIFLLLKAADKIKKQRGGKSNINQKYPFTLLSEDEIEDSLQVRKENEIASKGQIWSPIKKDFVLRSQLISFDWTSEEKDVVQRLLEGGYTFEEAWEVCLKPCLLRRRKPASQLMFYRLKKKMTSEVVLNQEQNLSIAYQMLKEIRDKYINWRYQKEIDLFMQKYK